MFEYNIKMRTKKTQIFNCELCSLITCNKKDYEKHLITSKHLMNLDLDPLKTKCLIHRCKNCGKNYKSRSGLWSHLKKCSLNEPFNIENSTSIIDLFKLQINENKELHNIIIEQNKQLIELSNKKNYTTNVNTNYNNKFNLNLFLNEQCKDAINIMDFVNSLKLNLTDLINTAKSGYVEGISKIFVKGLKELDIYKRPVHCSDLKREILYIKHEDEWTKEAEEKKKIYKAINYVTHKNIQLISQWVLENPLCKDSSSIKNDEYMELILNTMSGDSEKEQELNVNKIISKIAKEVIITKE